MFNIKNNQMIANNNINNNTTDNNTNKIIKTNAVQNIKPSLGIIKFISI